MIKFSASTEDDLDQIAAWSAADSYHKDNVFPNWWLTGSDGIFAGRVDDESGPVLYLRLDKEGDSARMSIQFAPLDLVSKGRVVSAIMTGFPKVAAAMKEQGYKSILFFSESPLLIRFMTRRLGFIPIDESDFVLKLEEN